MGHCNYILLYLKILINYFSQAKITTNQSQGKNFDNGLFIEKTNFI